MKLKKICQGIRENKVKYDEMLPEINSIPVTERSGANFA
jgi:hypothetical protein